MSNEEVEGHPFRALFKFLVIAGIVAAVAAGPGVEESGIRRSHRGRGEGPLRGADGPMDRG